MLEITPASTNPEVTDRGLCNIFHTCGRDGHAVTRPKRHNTACYSIHS
jgi:hypothetical protein